ncbi:MAG: ABC transporter ATP-binding protein [Alphaproteobacteria bacterium]|nr:ABC transporter ATP-binding protein [Alphaproteobacteria bacterium]MCY3752694.1 ABC transporter ATP-binding protein [Alphaproteobacteria bacterium]
MLEVQGLVTNYGMIEALKGVDISAAEGRITCVLGPNGAGKTTLLMTIAGLLRPRRGSVTFEGRDITAASSAAVVHQGLALVPENRLVFPDMTVRENLVAGAYTRLARNRGEAMADLDRMLERFPVLNARVNANAGTLSGGEQQMLAVARALMTKPRCLLMDEPSLGLAPLIVAEVFNIIRELNEDGVTILLVEQNAHMALTVAHHFFLLDQGLVAFDGDPGAMAEDEVIQRAYLGSAGG